MQTDLSGSHGNHDRWKPGRTNEVYIVMTSNATKREYVKVNQPIELHRGRMDH